MPKLEALPFSPLTAVTTIDGRYHSRTAPMGHFTSEYGLHKARLQVGVEYIIHQSKWGIIRPLSDNEADYMRSIPRNFSVKQADEIKKTEDGVKGPKREIKGTRHDLNANVKWLRRRMDGTSLSDLQEDVHANLTSEDENNLAYRLIMRGVTEQIIQPQMDGLIDDVMAMAQKNRDVVIVGRTHGQRGISTTFGKELAVFGVRMEKEAAKIRNFVLTGKLNGAMGTFASFATTHPEIDALAFSSDFVRVFGFEPNIFTTQTNPYEDVIEFLQAHQRFNGSLLDLDQDFWRYISDDWLKQKIVAGETGSSTMTNKVNPIDFENSAGNLKKANGLIDVFTRSLPVSRLQRDLEDSTLIREVGTALAWELIAITSTRRGFSRLSENLTRISDVLNVDWAILGEGAQQILRKYKVKNPYALVEKFTKGRELSEIDWRDWVENGLPQNIPTEAIFQLKLLTPASYIGEAHRITDEALKFVGNSKGVYYAS